MSAKAAAPSPTNPKTYFLLDVDKKVLLKFTQTSEEDLFYGSTDETIANTYETALSALLDLQKANDQLVVYHSKNPAAICSKQLSFDEYTASPFMDRDIHKCKINDAIELMHATKMIAHRAFNNFEKIIHNTMGAVMYGVEIPLLGVIPGAIICAIGVIQTITGIALSILFATPAIFSKNARIAVARSFKNVYYLGPKTIVWGLLGISYALIFCWFKKN